MHYASLRTCQHNDILIMAGDDETAGDERDRETIRSTSVRETNTTTTRESYCVSLLMLCAPNQNTLCIANIGERHHVVAHISPTHRLIAAHNGVSVCSTPGAVPVAAPTV